MLVLLLVIGFGEVKREQAAAQEHARDVARETASRVREMRAESRVFVQRVASQISADDAASCGGLFSAVALLPRYAGVFLFDAAGKLVCRGNARLDATGALPSVQAALSAGELAGGRPVIKTFNGSALIVEAWPLKARTGTLVLLERTDAIRREALVPGSVTTIVDREGTIVTRSHGAYGVSRVSGFAAVPELGWSIYVDVPEVLVLEPVREMLLSSTVGAGVVVVIVFLMTLALARKIGRSIDALVAAAGKAEDGTYGRVELIEGPLEIATLTHAFNRMVDRREEAEERMRSDERRLKALSERLLTVQEEERTRISRELHDNLGQSLTALKMDVIGLLQAAAQPPSVASIRDRILRTLDDTVTAVQQISSELRPSELDDLGLVAAMEAEALLFEERSGIECELSVVGEEPGDRDCVTTIYRIVQESLTNVARHSNATRVELRLRNAGDELHLQVRDDGRGITEEETADPRSLGLLGIRERAALVGGTVSFEGTSGGGTVVSVRIPMPPKGRIV